MREDPTSIETSPFAGLPTALGHGRGVIASERPGLGVARIAARKGRSSALVELFGATYGVEPPNAPRWVSRADVCIAGIAPQTWLAMRERAGNAFPHALQSLLGQCALVADQSDAHAIVRLTGPKVRQALAKLLPIDIHPRTFQVGDLAQTVCGYMNVMLWRVQDSAPDAAAFEIWAGRSLAASLHEAISHAAAEFGFVREPAEVPAHAPGGA